MIRTQRATFVMDFDNFDNHVQEYMTEVDLTKLVIQHNKTLTPPFFQLFREYRENRRTLREYLFSSSKLEKIINYVDKYLSNGNND